MPILPDAFWGSNYYDHPPLTDEMVRMAEERLRVRLPEEYLALLRIQNGGYTRGFVYPTSQPTTWASDHVPLDDLAGIVHTSLHYTPLNVLSTEYLTEEWGLPPHLVLLSGDGHWWIALDYRKGPVPSVAWLDTEREQDLQIAPNFAVFLNGLLPQSSFIPDEP
ncbi:MAG: SMI1/KNR4 family protein [FCB group bacterium]|jgi:hypothetical protein|nr:SMI1/KNR4 family protein [FCB group bacterium]